MITFIFQQSGKARAREDLRYSIRFSLFCGAATENMLRVYLPFSQLLTSRLKQKLQFFPLLLKF